MKTHLLDTLTHIYYYYIHGPPAQMCRKDCEQEFKSVDVELRCHFTTASAAGVAAVHLAEWHDAYLDSTEGIAPLQFSGSVESGGIKSTVEGIVYYFPFDQQETLPLNGRCLPDSGPTVELYWAGRLIPYERVTLLPVNSERQQETLCSLQAFAPCKTLHRNRPEKVPSECFRRSIIHIFFDNALPVTQQKVKFLCGISGSLMGSTTKLELLTAFSQRSVKRNMAATFRSWLLRCHLRDTEYIVENGTLKLMRGKETEQLHSPGDFYEEKPQAGHMPVLLVLVAVHKDDGQNAVEYVTMKRLPVWLFSPDGKGDESKLLHNSWRQLCGLHRLSGDEELKRLELLNHKLPQKLLLFTWQKTTSSNYRVEAAPTSREDEEEYLMEHEVGTISKPVAVEIRDSDGKAVTKPIGSWLSTARPTLKLCVIRETFFRGKLEQIVQGDHADNMYFFEGMRVPEKAGRFKVVYKAVLRNKMNEVVHKFPSAKAVLILDAQGGPPANITCKIPKQFGVGEPVPLHIGVVDSFNNLLPCDAGSVKLACGALTVTFEEDHVTLTGKTSGVEQFQIDYKGVTKTKSVAVKPGPPAELVVAGVPEEVENGSKLTVDLRFLDRYGNEAASHLIQPCVLQVESELFGAMPGLTPVRSSCLSLSPRVNASKSGRNEVTFRWKHGRGKCCVEGSTVRQVTVLPSQKACTIKMFRELQALECDADHVFLVETVAGEQPRTLRLVGYNELGAEAQLSLDRLPIFPSGGTSYNPDTGEIVMNDEVVQNQLCSKISVPFSWNEMTFTLVFLTKYAGKPCKLCLSSESALKVMVGHPFPYTQVKLCDAFDNIVRILDAAEYDLTVQCISTGVLGEIDFSCQDLAKEPIVTGEVGQYELVVQDKEKRHKPACEHFHLIPAPPHHVEIRTQIQNSEHWSNSHHVRVTRDDDVDINVQAVVCDFHGNQCGKFNSKIAVKAFREDYSLYCEPKEADDKYFTFQLGALAHEVGEHSVHFCATGGVSRRTSGSAVELRVKLKEADLVVEVSPRSCTVIGMVVQQEGSSTESSWPKFVVTLTTEANDVLPDVVPPLRVQLSKCGGSASIAATYAASNTGRNAFLLTCASATVAQPGRYEAKVSYCNADRGCVECILVFTVQQPALPLPLSTPQPPQTPQQAPPPPHQQQLKVEVPICHHSRQTERDSFLKAPEGSPSTLKGETSIAERVDAAAITPRRESDDSARARLAQLDAELEALRVDLRCELGFGADVPFGLDFAEARLRAVRAPLREVAPFQLPRWNAAQREVVRGCTTFVEIATLPNRQTAKTVSQFLGSRAAAVIAKDSSTYKALLTANCPAFNGASLPEPRQYLRGPPPGNSQYLINLFQMCPGKECFKPLLAEVCNSVLCVANLDEAEALQRLHRPQSLILGLADGYRIEHSGFCNPRQRFSQPEAQFGVAPPGAAALRARTDALQRKVDALRAKQREREDAAASCEPLHKRGRKS
eukprot:TRINITY_DN211_c0_g1_i1.p1 TRINITY_DN211_c0_g1~~TRINITY_DN211_c0_g1_i1.p1  ORF type:complete len:1476 (-),score=280.86 TRINITY_DN211_c0_g1_i1:123-4550(-)